jgi:hypothetical protein
MNESKMTDVQQIWNVSFSNIGGRQDETSPTYRTLVDRVQILVYPGPNDQVEEIQSNNGNLLNTHFFNLPLTRKIIDFADGLQDPRMRIATIRRTGKTYIELSGWRDLVEDDALLFKRHQLATMRRTWREDSAGNLVKDADIEL